MPAARREQAANCYDLTKELDFDRVTAEMMRDDVEP